jgi:hypothetical protein
MQQLTKARAADLTVCGLRGRLATLEELWMLLAEVQAQDGQAPHENCLRTANAQ